MSERWLVTGAAGQLARSFLALAPSLSLEAVGLARAALDIADAEAVERALDLYSPDVVLNCAAFTQVDRCEAEEDAAQRANAVGPRILAERTRGRALLVHLSTDYVFPGTGSLPVAEDDPPAPQSAYGRTKLAGERAVREAGGDSLVVRAQWVFGPGQNFVRTILSHAARGGPLRVVEDQVGRPTWTGALARGLAGAVAAGARGALHLGCKGVASWYDLARAAVEEGARRGLCSRVEVVPIRTAEMPRPARRPAFAVLSLERARKLGIEMPHWRDALADYLDAEGEGRDA